MSFAPSQSLSASRQDKLLGLFVIIAVVVTLSIYVRSALDDSELWLTFDAKMHSSYGLSVGAPIKLNGINIGQIDQVELTPSGEVLIEFTLSTKYQNLYTTNSVLVVDTTLGINNVLSGAGLNFQSIPGPKLSEGAAVQVQEPQSLQSLMDEWDLEALANQVKDILNNLNEVMSTVRDNQQNVTASLNNIASMTETLAQASESLPSVLAKLDATLTTLQQTVTDTQSVLNQNVDVFNETLTTSTEMMQGINGIVNALEPTIESLPETQRLLDSVLLETLSLTEKLNQHWLLGDSQLPQSTTSISRPFIVLPPDESLYQSSLEPLKNSGGKTP